MSSIPENRELRYHQAKAIHDLRQGLMAGHKRQILMMPTGGGKTFVASTMIKTAHSKGKRCGFIVDRITLVHQAVSDLEREGLSVGVIQADHPQWDPQRHVQVCSIQTLARRTLPAGFFDFLIIDEVHCLRKAHLRLMEQFDVPVIGLSATPFSRGLGKYFSNLVQGGTTSKLIEDGFLVPFIAFGPSEPDLSKVRKARGDYEEKSLDKAVNQPKLVADVVDNWIEYGEDRQTICFAINIAHSKNIVEKFVSKGVNAHHIDAYTSDDERDKKINGFKNGDIRVLSSVGVLSIGFDAPNASCIILARPTMSLMLHIQQIGRGLRICEFKKDCIIFDHSGNHEILGYATDPLPNKLHDGNKEYTINKRNKEDPLPTKCLSCSYLKLPKVHQCPNCGFAPKKQSKVKHVSGNLVPIRSKIESAEEKQVMYGMLKGYASERGYKDGWAYYAYRNIYGVAPHRETVMLDPDTRCRKLVRYLDIKRAKSKQRRVG